MKHEKNSSGGRGRDSKRSKGKDACGKPRHGETAEQEGYYGEESYYPAMESSYTHGQQHGHHYEQQQVYSAQYASHYQQDRQHQNQHQHAYYSQSAPPASSASSGPKLSAILNHEEPSDEYQHHASTYKSASTLAPDSRHGSSGSMGSNGAPSKMALQHALSSIVPSTPSTTMSGPVDNSFASVVLSDQRSVTSASDATYTSHTQSQPQPQPQGYQTHDGHSLAMYASAEDFQKGKANLDYHYYHTHSSNNSDSYSHSHEHEHEHEHEQYTTSSLSTERDRRTSGSSKSSRHHNASASYTSEPSSRGPLASSRSDAKKTSSSKMASSKGRKDPKSEKGERSTKIQKVQSHHHNSHLYAATPSSSAGISSPAFSASDTPGQQTPRLVSIGAGSLGGSEGEGEGEGEGGFYEQDRNQDHDQDQDDNDNASSYGGPRDRGRGQRDTSSAQPQPAVQRERNRMAATKCRAKSKAAISKLEEEERMMSDQRQTLVAQKSALVDEMLNLREQLLMHGSCESGAYIKQYINNAARTIADSGGKQLIWGSDGTGKPWSGEDSYHGHGHDHDHSHDSEHDKHSKGHVKKEKKRK